MAHTHTVIDDDSRFVIDIDSRVISHPSEQQPVLVQHDHNSERFTFEIKRDIDGHDVTDCNLIRVHFINISATNANEFSASIYEVPIDDLKVDPDDDTLATFSWLVAQEATEYVGTLNFLVELACVNKDTLSVDYSWHSGVYEGIVISNGMDNSEYVIGVRYDVLDTWVAQFESRLEASANQAVSKVDDALESAEHELRARAAVISADLTRDVLTMHGILTQTTGDSSDKVMSQKAVTDKINTANARIDQILTNRGVTNSAFSEDISLSDRYAAWDGTGDYKAYSLQYTLGISGVSIKFTITGANYINAVGYAGYNHKIHMSHPLGNLPYGIKPTEEIRVDLGAARYASGTDAEYHKVYLILKTDGTIEYYTELDGGINTESTTPLPLEIKFMSPNEKQDYLNLPEITDARIDGNGNTHVTVGDAIRSQFGAVSDEFKNTWDEMRWEQSQFVDIIDRNDKRIDNIEQILDPVPVVIDSDTEYEKIVPAGVLPSALIEKVGGMSRKCTNYAVNNTVRDIENAGLRIVVENGNSFFTVNGTSTATQSSPTIRYFILQPGTYTASVIGINSGDRLYLAKKDGTIIINYIELNAPKTFTITEEDEYFMQFIYDANSKYSNTEIKVQINEGSTALPYEPYFPGIRHAKVTALESNGKNLVDISKALNDNFVDNGDGTYTMTKTGSNRFSARIPFYLPAGTTVYYSATIVASSGIAQSQKGLQIQLIPADSWTPDCTSNTNNYATPKFDVGRMSFYLDSEDAEGAYITVKDVQVEYGSAKTEYKPYSAEPIDTFEIPLTVQASLDGYGLGVSTDYNNHIEYTDDGRVKYVQMCKEVTFDGTENWTRIDAENNFNLGGIRSAFSPAKELGGSPSIMICSHYTPRFANEQGCAYMSNTSFSFIDANYPTLGEWKMHLANLKANGNPLTVVYALKRPIEIDITDLITPDNYLRIQSGGRIVAVNEHNQGAFTQIVYQKKEGA